MGPWTRPLVREFIKIYREEENLWRVKSAGYYDRDMRNEAYDALLVKLQQFVPEATKDMMLGKIRSIRTGFRKENVKIVQSIRQGARGDQVYEPRIWYYNQLEFLAAQEGNEMVLRPQSRLNPHLQPQEKASISTSGNHIAGLTPTVKTETLTSEIDHNPVTVNAASDVSDPEPDPDSSSPAETLHLQCDGAPDPGNVTRPQPTGNITVGGKRQKSPRPRAVIERYQHVGSRCVRNRRHNWNKRDKPEPENMELMSDDDTNCYGLEETREQSDSLSLFGQYVAKCLGEMTVEQSTHAQKLMFDVIYEGKLRNLSRHTHLIHET